MRKLLIHQILTKFQHYHHYNVPFSSLVTNNWTYFAKGWWNYNLTITLGLLNFWQPYLALIYVIVLSSGSPKIPISLFYHLLLTHFLSLEALQLAGPSVWLSKVEQPYYIESYFYISFSKMQTDRMLSIFL